MWAACDDMDPGHQWKAWDIVYCVKLIESAPHHHLIQGDTDCAHLAEAVGACMHACPLVKQLGMWAACDDMDPGHQ